MTKSSKIRYDYVWLDGEGGVRTKTRYFPYGESIDHDKLSWSYDGSSTGQATCSNSEVFLAPVRSYTRFDEGRCILLCETYENVTKNSPHPSNKRHEAENVFKKLKHSSDPWFGYEMEFFIVNNNDNCNNTSNRPFYCTVGDKLRNIIEEFVELCHHYDVNLVGTNSEVAPDQWEYQIFGHGIHAVDDVIVSKYLLELVSAKHDYHICWHPKPFSNFNGSGMHVNFSTNDMRHKKTGMIHIENAINKLGETHLEDIKNYGVDNHLRLTGCNETAKYDNFSWGISSREVSIRVNAETAFNGGGYFEDRRPASNADPYVVARILTLSVLD